MCQNAGEQPKAARHPWTCPCWGQFGTTWQNRASASSPGGCAGGGTSLASHRRIRPLARHAWTEFRRPHPVPFAPSRPQAIDCNQEGYLEESLKICNVLREFDICIPGGGPPAIVGFREHIFSNLGTLGTFAATAELVFGTLVQRTLARPLWCRSTAAHQPVPPPVHPRRTPSSIARSPSRTGLSPPLHLHQPRPPSFADITTDTLTSWTNLCSWRREDSPRRPKVSICARHEHGPSTQRPPPRYGSHCSFAIPRWLSQGAGKRARRESLSPPHPVAPSGRRTSLRAWTSNCAGTTSFIASTSRCAPKRPDRHAVRGEAPA